MTTPQPQPVPVKRLLLVAACVLFVIAALAIGGVFPGWGLDTGLAFGFGAFAAWVLSGAVP